MRLGSIVIACCVLGTRILVNTLFTKFYLDCLIAGGAVALEVKFSGACQFVNAFTWIKVSIGQRRDFIIAWIHLTAPVMVTLLGWGGSAIITTIFITFTTYAVVVTDIIL
jgi:hypothetical protein